MMPRMVLCAGFPLAAVAMLGLLNVACSNDRASTSHYSKAGPTAGAAFPDPEVKHPRRRQFLRFAVSGLAAAVFSGSLGKAPDRAGRRCGCAARGNCAPASEHLHASVTAC